ncbi:hypothetical protein DPEC_G00342090 [Dallia pectoralis]|uniref:Uncharacterized protein n=1 Tax=Dallia pectoralis TaxID=75939 RepID=A0ACC2F5K4_DALPE|nr:hypothetical protein DPEC_G00342090 [Dallia pectoralis]
MIHCAPTSEAFPLAISQSARHLTTVYRTPSCLRSRTSLRLCTSSHLTTVYRTLPVPDHKPAYASVPSAF